MIPLALVMGAVGVPWTLFLPTNYDPWMFIVAGMVGLSSMLALIIGLSAFAGMGSLKTGQLNISSVEMILCRT